MRYGCCVSDLAPTLGGERAGSGRNSRRESVERVVEGLVSWVYTPRVRGKAVALATSANWAFSMELALFVPLAFTNIRWQTYTIFGCFLVAMLIHVFFMFPETAGKTLEKTEQIFEDPTGIPYIGTPAWKTFHDTKRTIAAEHSDVEVLGEKLRASVKRALSTTYSENVTSGSAWMGDMSV
ncbi:hypothetical protein N7510_007012 [Penicillium lagena]|uniref:uncharacterized protein n=1 Tax=Penicillium lagena TaxID=94218 RepID=UPI002541932B|nr:uncharacterized protein N7510_007012 [Penicillium lagena]KAJ5610293.1 hypothetical protein N7510_007012 [Penicillium lagena]